MNLRCVNNDIAFHFNPRFDESRPVVVCNTEQGRHWGPEERTYVMPFQHGTYFEMITKVQGHCYQVRPRLLLVPPPGPGPLALVTQARARDERDSAGAHKPALLRWRGRSESST